MIQQILKLLSFGASTKKESYVVGTLLSNQTNSHTLSDTSVYKNAHGGISSSTSHQLVNTYDAWIKDIATGKEIKVSGDGKLEAREGHDVGFFHNRGKAIVEMNFTTGSCFKTINVTAHPIGTPILGLMAAVIGFLLFPIFLLLNLVIPNHIRPIFGQFQTPNMIPVTRLLLIIATFFYLILPNMMNAGGFLDSSRDFNRMVAYYFAGSAIFCFIAAKCELKAYSNYVQKGKDKLNAMYAQAKADRDKHLAADVGADRKLTHPVG